MGLMTPVLFSSPLLAQLAGSAHLSGEKVPCRAQSLPAGAAEASPTGLPRWPSPAEGLPWGSAQCGSLSDDHSRVKLSQLGEDPHSDYINANFIPVSAHLPSPPVATGHCHRNSAWVGAVSPSVRAGGHEVLVKAQLAHVEVCGCPLAGVGGACEVAKAVMHKCECGNTGKALCFLLVDCILCHHLPAYCPVSLPALFPSGLCSCI